MWKKTVGQVHLLSACGSCLPIALKVVVCLLLYYFSPGALSRSLALHVTLNQGHIAMAVIKCDLCLFCCGNWLWFQQCPQHRCYHGKAAAKPSLCLHLVIEKGPCPLANLKCPFLVQFLHLWSKQSFSISGVPDISYYTKYKLHREWVHGQAPKRSSREWIYSVLASLW